MVHDQQPAAPGPAVLVAKRDGIATLTLNRPARRNAVSWQLVVGLIEGLEALRSDDEVRVVVLTGAGRDFCVGADLALVSSSDRRDHEARTLRGRSVEDDLERLSYASRAAELLVAYPKPTIAKVNGACAGAGLSLALAADFSIAASSSVINTAFVGAGVSGDLGSAWLLSRAVGGARARALLLDPVKMTADRAAALGIITEVATDLDARADELAHKLAGQAPLAMHYAKQNAVDASTLGLADYLQVEVARMVESARSGDAHRASRSFIEARAASHQTDRT